MQRDAFAAYWTDTARQARREKARGERWWYRSLSLLGPIGAFWEVYRPSVADTETTFSHPFPEGYARTADRMSGRTDTHVVLGIGPRSYPPLADR